MLFKNFLGWMTALHQIGIIIFISHQDWGEKCKGRLRHTLNKGELGFHMGLSSIKTSHWKKKPALNLCLKHPWQCGSSQGTSFPGVQPNGSELLAKSGRDDSHFNWLCCCYTPTPLVTSSTLNPFIDKCWHMWGPTDLTPIKLKSWDKNHLCVNSFLIMLN